MDALEILLIISDGFSVRDIGVILFGSHGLESWQRFVLYGLSPAFVGVLSVSVEVLGIRRLLGVGKSMSRATPYGQVEGACDGSVVLRSIAVLTVPPLHPSSAFAVSFA